jgi:Protein of unknown function (DUF2878)
MSFWGNLIGYQLVWFTAVIGASHGKTWPGVTAGALFVLWQMLIAEYPHTQTRLLLTALVLGIVIEGVLARTGWATYAASAPAAPSGGAPLWILALWASFSMTLNRSLAYLRNRLWLAMVFGAIGAPLAYLGAQRGWASVIFQPPVWRGLTWIACSWAIAMPLLAFLARRWTSHSAGKLAPARANKS